MVQNMVTGEGEGQARKKSGALLFFRQSLEFILILCYSILLWRFRE